MPGSKESVQEGLQLDPEDQALFRELCALKRTPPNESTVTNSSSSSKSGTTKETNKKKASSNKQNKNVNVEEGRNKEQGGEDAEEEQEGQLEWSLRRALTGTNNDSSSSSSSNKLSDANNNLFFTENNFNPSQMDQLNQLSSQPYFNPSSFLQSSENNQNSSQTQQNDMMRTYQEMQNIMNQNLLQYSQFQQDNGGSNEIDSQNQLLPFIQQQHQFSAAQAAAMAQYPFHQSSPYDILNQQHHYHHSNLNPNLMQDFYLMGGRTELIDGVYVRVDKNGNKYIGAYSPSERVKRIKRFHEKRKRSLRAGLASQHAGKILEDSHKLNSKKNKTSQDSQNGNLNRDVETDGGVRAERMIRYGVRKQFADSRMRVKGRFVKKEDENLLRELMSIA